MTHSELVKSLVKPGVDIMYEMTPLQAHLTHMVMGVSGEAGELLDAIKKHTIYQKPIDFVNIIEELGDLEFYLEGIRQALDIQRDFILQCNIEKLTTRYGENLRYSNQAAIDRNDKKPL